MHISQLETHQKGLPISTSKGSYIQWTNSWWIAKCGQSFEPKVHESIYESIWMMERKGKAPSLAYIIPYKAGYKTFVYILGEFRLFDLWGRGLCPSKLLFCMSFSFSLTGQWELFWLSKSGFCSGTQKHAFLYSLPRLPHLFNSFLSRSIYLPFFVGPE